jgi:predicted permease
MNLWHKIQSGFRALFRKEKLDQEMDEEMRAHIGLRTQANMAAGMNPDEARYAALRSFGGMEQVKEVCRDLRGVGWIETFWQDVRFGLRMLRRNSGFTAVAVLILAIGIAASTTLFSVMQAVFLGQCPYQDPQTLVCIYETNPAKNQYRLEPSGPSFRDWREQNHVFEQIAVNDGRIDFRVRTADAMEKGGALFMSQGFFSMLGVRPTLGRPFLPEEYRGGGERVVILSYTHWQRWFHGDPSVIGKTLQLDDEVYTVVGVLPASFRWVFQPLVVGLWLPFKETDRTDRAGRGVQVLARLKPGVSLAQAQADMDVIANRLAQTYPDTNAGFGAIVAPINQEYARSAKSFGNPRALWMLWGIVNAVLLIGCLNVANLLLIRAAGREREMAIRAALGSGRLRLIRQLLTECFLLASLGGLVGVMLTGWALKIVSALRGQTLPWNLGSSMESLIPWFVEVRLDGWALLYVLATSLLTCGLFGLGPALGAVKTNLSRSLSGAQSTLHGTPFRKGLALFVVSEVTIACVLLLGAGLLVNSAIRLRTIHPGCNPKNVVSLGIYLKDPKYSSVSEQKRYFQEVLAGLRTLPGVEYADVGGPTPAGGGGGNPPTRIEGDESDQEHRDIRFLPASPDCFRVLQIPLLRGRFFTDRDNEAAPLVLIINEGLAHRYWPNVNPLGRHITAQLSKTNSVSFEVVGVVGNVYSYLNAATSPPEAYTCWLQRGASVDMDVGIRTASDPAPMTATVQRAVRALDDRVEIHNLCTLEEGISRFTWSWSRQFNTLFLGGFAAIAFLLASIGVYGVTAYSVSQRTHEIGIRMALGAQRENVLALVLRQGMILTGVGIGVGVAGGLGLTRVARSLLFGITPTDPLTFGLITLLVGAVAFVACWFPARRAARLDPMVALRYE